MAQTVLTIDDCPEIHELMEIRLASEELTQYHAVTAKDGLEQAQSIRPDLILLDVMMPDSTGFAICEQLKRDPGTMDIPIIFISAVSDTFDKVRGLDLGAVDYITKPFDAAELRARVRAALRMRRYQQLLAQKAQIDALTALKNRAYFDARLQEEVAASLRFGRSLCLLMLDVDRFKRLNDEFGHPFGDQVLQDIGDLLIDELRLTDVACRYGGEEFALILTETSVDNGLLAAERVLAKIAASRRLRRGILVPVTASAGLACSTHFENPSTLTPALLLDAADQALYAAKAAGRNCVKVAVQTAFDLTHV